jgi:hypothetical protein
MPRYFFDVQVGEKAEVDEIGLEFVDDQRARGEATKAITELAL